MCDNLLQLALPETPLTDILKDFRQYRPGNHREFLESVRDCAQQSGVREFAKKDSVSAALYLQALDQVRDFRWRHWCFTREYILKHTSHPTATGGSPIVTVSYQTLVSRPKLTWPQWLPNQLTAVLTQMAETFEHCKAVKGASDIMEAANHQREMLRKEVEKYCGERGVAAA
jgi:indoleamine 2,3-dioxygenase